MEEPFEISAGFNFYTVTPTGTEEFIIDLRGERSIIRRTLDEFERWELVEGKLSKTLVESIGEQIEKYYD